MLPLEYEIDRLKEIFQEMFELVRDQLTLTKEALLSNDSDIASEVMRKERRVNSYELTIDRECEDFLALHSPVAVDLRMVIAILKMSTNLERIGDHAYRISSYIYDEEVKFKKELLELVELPTLFDDLDKMFEIIGEAFESEDAKTAKQVFKKDKLLDKMNKKIPALLENQFKDSKQEIATAIILARIVGKLERCGDMITNMAEELLFYKESKILKHKQKNKQIKKRFSSK